MQLRNRMSYQMTLVNRIRLLVFEKIYLCFFIPSYTRNHVIIYTNSIIFFFLTHASVKLLTHASYFSFHSYFYLFNRFEKVLFPNGGNANRDISCQESVQP